MRKANMMLTFAVIIVAVIMYVALSCAIIKEIDRVMRKVNRAYTYSEQLNERGY